MSMIEARYSLIILDLPRSRDHLSIYTLHGEPLFFQHFDGPLFPTLKLLHKCEFCIRLRAATFLVLTYVDPFLLPSLQIDRGAIRFLLGGAHMMCPGFTSPGGKLPPSEEALTENTPVAIMAEGKEHAVGIGVTKLSTEDIKKINKGVGVEITCYLGDDLWSIDKLQ